MQGSGNLTLGIVEKSASWTTNNMYLHVVDKVNSAGGGLNIVFEATFGLIMDMCPLLIN